MSLQNKIEKQLETVGVTAGEFKVREFAPRSDHAGARSSRSDAFMTFTINTANTVEVARAVSALNTILRGQRVIIERFEFERHHNFDGYEKTSFQIENPTITVTQGQAWPTGLAIDPFDQKFLDGENEFTEINTHELRRGTQTLNGILWNDPEAVNFITSVGG
jgi:hypothetical protein